MADDHLAALEIEPTNICKNSCVICPRSIMKRPEGLLELEIFNIIVERAKSFRFERFTIAGLGEPFYNSLTPLFVTILRQEFPEAEISVFTSTRGMNDDIVNKLCEARINYLNISFFGYDKESYESMMPGMDFNRTLGIIAEFLHRKSKNSRLFLLPRTTKILDDQRIKRLKETLKKYGLQKCDIMNRPCHNFGGHFHDKKYVDADFYEKKHSFVPDASTRCRIPISNTFISWNGDIFYCYIHSVAENALGNIRDKDFETIEIELHTRFMLITKSGIQWSDTCSRCNAYATYRSKWSFRVERPFEHHIHE